MWSCALLVCYILCCAAPQYSETAAITGYLSEDVKVDSRKPIKIPGQGGEGGVPFDDVDFVEEIMASIARIRAINISYGDFVNSIQVVYSLAKGSQYQTPSRGNFSNPFVTILLDSIEHVMLIEGTTNGTVINELTITTIGPDYEKKVYGPFGKPGPLQFTMKGHIFAFHGRYGNFLTNLGVYSFEEITKGDELGEGSGGSVFDDEVDILTPPVVGISSLHLLYGDFVNGIQVEYLLLGGSTVLGEKHGGENATFFTIITFEDEEVIDMMEMKTSSDDGAYISMLSFTTRKKDGQQGVYGPFGRKGDKVYTQNGNILGIYGHAGIYIDSLGFYYI